MFGCRAAQAQTAADVQAAVTKACAVMSGNQKADGQFLQIMMLMDDDMSDPNPVAYGIQRGVLQQCPKSYLAFKQRERATNPFAAHPLIQGSTSLVNGGSALLATPAPPQDSAFYCRGGSPMASRSGATLVVHFQDPGHPAAGGLSPGQCTWWSRNLRATEPRTIEANLANPKQAQNGLTQINAGGRWTFWVYNVKDQYFNTTAIAKGYTQKKP
jgi:hypothetical protein